MKVDPKLIEYFKFQQTKELLEVYEASDRGFDLDKALGSAQTRLLNAIAFVEKDQVSKSAGSILFLVVDRYLVTEDQNVIKCQCPKQLVTGLHCQCEDHKHRKTRCKHLLAAGLFLASLEKEGKRNG